MAETEIIENISTHFTIQIYQACDHNERSIKALEIIAKSLKELYRYFEPTFFSGQFFLCKNFNDDPLFDTKDGQPIIDKTSVLFNRTDGTIVIQVGDDGRFTIWDNPQTDGLQNRNDTLVYLFENDTECFLANGQQINIPYDPPGSMFADHYYNLIQVLERYKIERVLRSSCPFFSLSWTDKNRCILFKGGPEKDIQDSLEDFLSANLRGISMEINREFNLGGGEPKPVDIRVHWNEANRIALLEVKWLGKSIGDRGQITADWSDQKVNQGLVQLKGYFDTAQKDFPFAIVKAFLIVIDGRRNNTTKDTIQISYADGMHFQYVDLVIDADKRYFESIPGFERPVRMFAAPIVS